MGGVGKGRGGQGLRVRGQLNGSCAWGQQGSTGHLVALCKQPAHLEAVLLHKARCRHHALLSGARLVRGWACAVWLGREAVRMRMAGAAAGLGSL